MQHGPGLLEFVDVLRECAEAHLRWALALSRRGIAGDAEQPVPPAGACDKFEAWRRQLSETVPARARPWLDEAGTSHASLHRAAAVVERAATAPRPVLTPAYDAFVAELQRFERAVWCLERELWQEASLTDFLTGFRNRYAMARELEAHRQRVARDGSPCTLVVMDLDRFKGLNDHHGHAQGDEVIKRIAARVHERIRPYDSVYRLGGDEFLVCLPETGLEQARAVVERLRMGIEVLDTGAQPAITASFGLVLMDGEAPVNAVVERADAALYAAKRSGGNAVVAWNRSLGMARTGTGA